MIYTGQFRDITNKLYTVRLTTKSGTESKDITLGGTPFTTQMDSGGKTIYKPVKYQSGTVSIITPDYNFDIYNAKAQDTKVELLDGSTLVWTGYVTPNLYDMGFVEEREEVQIECIDALSTLQYIKYESEDKGMITFLELIRKILQRCNAYTYFYVSGNTQLSKEGTPTLLDKLYISESNFFDKKEDKETDEDVAWTMKDVLEEVCQYLGLTAIADGNKVLFLDYDAIKQNRTYYHRYNVDGNDTGTLTSLSFRKKIEASDYSESGATLSLDNVYNKVSVTDDLYTFDSLIPDVFDYPINITDTYDQGLVNNTEFHTENYGMNLGRFPIFINQTNQADIKSDCNTIAFVAQPNANRSASERVTNIVFARYYDSRAYKFFKYTRKNQQTLQEVDMDSLNYSQLQHINGATAAQYCVKQVRENFRGNNRVEIFNNLMADNDISDIKYSNYIVLAIEDANCYAPQNNKTAYPFFQTISNDNSMVFGGKNAYILISGSLRNCYSKSNCYPCSYPQYEFKKPIVKNAPDALYLLAKLEWNGLYWNGSTWTNQESTFTITFMKGNLSDEDRALEKYIFTDLEFLNTAPWYAGVDGKGYLIPMPEDQVIGGQPIFTMYCQSNLILASGKYGSLDLQPNTALKQDCVLLKDFKIKAIIGDVSSDQANDSDTVYANVIDDDFVAELKPIKFKICTWDNKKPNYSSVAYKDGNGYKYLDKTYNIACFTGEQYWTGSDSDAPDTSTGLRQEEHLIYRLVNQYSTPSVVLKLSLRNNNKVYGLYTDTTIANKNFIVDSMDIDYKMNKQELRLIEKK